MALILAYGHGLPRPLRFPYSRSWRERACGTIKGPHAPLTIFLDWTRRIQGLADRSHEGDGPHQLYGTDQFTCHPGVPRRWALPPRAALHNRPQRGRTIA